MPARAIATRNQPLCIFILYLSCLFLYEFWDSDFDSINKQFMKIKRLGG